MSPGENDDRAFIEHAVRLAIVAATAVVQVFAQDLVARYRESPFYNVPRESDLG